MALLMEVALQVCTGVTGVVDHTQEIYPLKHFCLFGAGGGTHGVTQAEQVLDL